MGDFHPAALGAMREALPLIEQGKIREAIDIVEPFQPDYIIDCFYVPETVERFPDDETIEYHRQFIIQWIDRMVNKGDGYSGCAVDALAYLESEYVLGLRYFDDYAWYTRDAYLQRVALAQRNLHVALLSGRMMTGLPGKAGSELTVERFQEYARQVADLDLLPTEAEDAERDQGRGEYDAPFAADKRGPWEVTLRKLAERGEVLNEHGCPVYTLDE